MTAKQNERLAAALEGISLGLNSIGKIMQDRMEREFPPEKERVDGEVFKAGENEGSEAEITPGPGRFERLLKKAIG